jgi:hypothetical protein
LSEERTTEGAGSDVSAAGDRSAAESRGGWWWWLWCACPQLQDILHGVHSVAVDLEQVGEAVHDLEGLVGDLEEVQLDVAGWQVPLAHHLEAPVDVVVAAVLAGVLEVQAFVIPVVHKVVHVIVVRDRLDDLVAFPVAEQFAVGGGFPIVALRGHVLGNRQPQIDAGNVLPFDAAAAKFWMQNLRRQVPDVVGPGLF